jgi:malonyl CoA-acyl carrier protein transacylase
MKKEIIKNTKLNPTPKTIREFKYRWLKEEFICYSDEQIRNLLKEILKNDKKWIRKITIFKPKWITINY